jgi:hypothetical protein
LVTNAALCKPRKCRQFAVAIRCHELRLVEFNPAPNGNRLVWAADAIAIMKNKQPKSYSFARRQQVMNTISDPKKIRLKKHLAR